MSKANIFTCMVCKDVVRVYDPCNSGHVLSAWTMSNDYGEKKTTYEIDIYRDGFEIETLPLTRKTFYRLSRIAKKSGVVFEKRNAGSPWDEYKSFIRTTGRLQDL